MAFNKMDPSCAIGFYCRTREDFDIFCKDAKQVDGITVNTIKVMLGP